MPTNVDREDVVDVAVTGSSGFIGSALVERLREQGHRVLRIVRSAGGADTARWDIDSGTFDGAALEGFGAVIHLAGEGIANRRWSDAQKRRIRESRVKGTTLLANTLAGLSSPPARLLSGSAIGFYGDRGQERLDESSAAGAGFLAEVCQEWEAATSPAEAAGISVTHLRTGLVLDPSGGALQRQLPIFRFGLGGRLGRGRQQMSWITRDDYLDAVIHLLSSELSGPVNLTAPNPVDNVTFTKALGTALGRPTVLPVPGIAPAALLGRELADELLFSSAHVTPRALLDDGFEFSASTIDEAFAAIL